MEQSTEPLLTWLRQLMKERGLNVAALAGASGIERSRLRRLLKGSQEMLVSELVPLIDLDIGAPMLIESPLVILRNYLETVYDVPIGEATAERYALIYAGLRSSGQPIPTNDLWIAASSMEHATELVTLDRDFSRVAQILVALYEP